MRIKDCLMDNKKTINDITMYKGDCLSMMDRLIGHNIKKDKR